MNGRDITPEQRSGASSNTETNRVFDSADAAAAFYKLARKRLLMVNGWGKLASWTNTDFALTDGEGNVVERLVEIGDHFRIDVPGPGTKTGEGYDWVLVESIEERNDPQEDSLSIQVRPCTSPVNDRNDTAHFFSEEATSTFFLGRKDNEVKAGVYGRNEKPNTGTEKSVDSIRNAAVAAAAISGVAKLQWKSLISGLLNDQ